MAAYDLLITGTGDRWQLELHGDARSVTVAMFADRARAFALAVRAARTVAARGCSISVHVAAAPRDGAVAAPYVAPAATLRNVDTLFWAGYV